MDQGPSPSAPAFARALPAAEHQLSQEGSSAQTAADLAQLATRFAAESRVVVAFSGGVDSTLVLAVAHQVLGERVLALTGVSPSLAQAERQEARALAARIGARQLEIPTYEMQDPRYRANAGDRCYYCKSDLYARLAEIARQEGQARIADGTHAGDLTDVRPGLQAAAEHQVWHPLAEAGLDKAAVRRLSAHLGLPTWDKPEMACLASRLPAGVPVTVLRLRRAEQAEGALKQLGFRQLRVRDLGTGSARIEIAREEMARIGRDVTAAELESLVLACGFESVVIDPAGYKRGGAGSAPAQSSAPGAGTQGRV